NATVGVAISHAVQAEFGEPPYTFSGPVHGLPDGLSIDASGNITGTPTAAGRFHLSVTVIDSATPKPHKAHARVLLQVAPSAIVLGPMSLPDGNVGASYAQTLNASGGSAPYTFAIVADALPPGLKLSTGGKITGKPTMNGSWVFTVEATDKYGFTGT